MITKSRQSPAYYGQKTLPAIDRLLGSLSRVYAADGDCVGITTQIPWAKNRQWLRLLAECGAPLFISAQPEATGAEQKAYIKECFAMAARRQPLGEPLDWLSNPQPTKWRLNERVVEFDWS